MYQMCRINMQQGEKFAENLRNKIFHLAEKIRSGWNVDKVILYGSLARGDFNEGSDIDLIVVADFSERFHKRSAEILEMTPLPVEPICYTKEEFEDMIRNKNSFLLSVIDEEILI